MSFDGRTSLRVSYMFLPQGEGRVSADFSQLQSPTEMTKQESSFPHPRLGSNRTRRKVPLDAGTELWWQVQLRGPRQRNSLANTVETTTSASHMSASSAPNSFDSSQECICIVPLEDHPTYFFCTLALSARLFYSPLSFFYSLLSFSYWLALLPKFPSNYLTVAPIRRSILL